MTITADEDTATTEVAVTSAPGAVDDDGRGGAADGDGGDPLSASRSAPSADAVSVVDEIGGKEKNSTTIDTTAFDVDNDDAVDVDGEGLDKKEILRLTSPSYNTVPGDDEEADADTYAKAATNVGSYRVSGFSEVALAAAAGKMDEEVDDVEDDLQKENDEDEEGLVASVTTAAVTSVPAATETTSTTTADDHPIADAVTRDELVEEVRAQLLRESVLATEIVAVTDDDDDDFDTDFDIENNRRGDDGRSYDDNTTFTGGKSASTAMTLGHSDREQESHSHDVEKFMQNSENLSNKKLDTATDISNDKKKRLVAMLIVAIIVVIGATIGIVVGVTSRNNQDGTSSASSSSSGSTATSTGVGIDGDVGGASTDDSGFVYMINMKPQHWCGHNDHTALSCGGHLASVLNPTEKKIVDDLTKIAIEESSKWNITWRYNEKDDRHIFFNQSLGMRGVWLGGRQSLYYHNDTTGSDILDVYHYEDDGTMLTTWEWGDYSGPWYDGDVADGASAGSFWAAGQPDNRVFLAPEDKNRTFGEDALFLGEDGLYYDMQTCQGFTAFQGPGILRLPTDYDDRTKYPDCKNSEFFLTDHQVPAPPRPPATTYEENTHVYALDLQPLSHCNAIDRAVWCGGELASITNEEELVVVYQLAFKAHFHSPRDPNFGAIGKIYSVWLGGMVGESSDDNNGWHWTDGSQWYDDDGKLWWSEVDGSFSGVDIARPYAMRLSSIDRVHNDAEYIQKFIPWRLDDKTLWAISDDAGRNITTFESETGRVCVGDFRVPVLNTTAAIYRLPSDYLDRAKYPSCQIGAFKHVFKAPERST